MPNFNTPEPITVTVDAGAANIRVTTAECADTIVEVTPTNPSRPTDVTAAEQTTVEYVGGHLRIATPRQPNRPAKARRVDIDIQVPSGSALRGETQLGDLTVRGRLGGCDYSLKAGDITVDEIGGGTVETSAGRILIGRITGSAKLTTAQGDIRINEAVRGTVEARTSHGHLDVGVGRGSAVTNLTTNTGMGGVSNRLYTDADGAAAEQVAISLRTSFGDIAVHRFAGDTTAVRA